MQISRGEAFQAERSASGGVPGGGTCQHLKNSHMTSLAEREWVWGVVVGDKDKVVIMIVQAQK